MASVRGVFCDLDGTLVATEKANFAAYRAALGEFGVEFTWPVFVTTWGEDSRDFLPRIAPELSAGEVAGVRAAKARHFPLSSVRPNSIARWRGHSGPGRTRHESRWSQPRRRALWPPSSRITI